jgi:hypothetical protein
LIYLLDTSGINRLHDDPDCDAIKKGLISTNEVWISALNVAEVGQTSELSHRMSLLHLLKELTQGRRPLEFPTILIQRGIEAYSRRLPSIDISISEKSEDIWQVLIDPTLLDDEALSKWSEPLQRFEKDFLETHRSARPHFQNLIANGKPILKSAAELLRVYASNETFLYDIVNPIYKKIVHDDLPASETMDLLLALPQLTGFLLTWGHSIYRRSIARSGYGTRNAGNVDIWFGAYLAQVDRFVTDDLKQYQALRLIARMIAPKCEVLRYDSFRRRLVI